MPGLMSGLMPPGEKAGAQPRQRAAERNPMGQRGDEQPNVSPEEQQQYDTFVANGMNILYDEKVMPGLLDRVRASGDPVEGVASTAAMVVMRLEDSARQQGQEIPPDVKYHGGIDLLEQIIDLSEEAGLHEFSEEDIERATLMAMDMYREMHQGGGTLDTEAIAADMEALMAADQQGALDEVLPGASQYAEMRGQAGAQAQPEGRRGLMR